MRDRATCSVPRGGGVSLNCKVCVRSLGRENNPTTPWIHDLGKRASRKHQGLSSAAPPAGSGKSPVNGYVFAVMSGTRGGAGHTYGTHGRSKHTSVSDACETAAVTSSRCNRSQYPHSSACRKYKASRPHDPGMCMLLKYKRIIHYFSLNGRVLNEPITPSKL
jgi:hypothetical protein